jgi:hypothetical protein
MPVSGLPRAAGPPGVPGDPGPWPAARAAAAPAAGPALIFALALATRSGYFAYSVGLLGWLMLAGPVNVDGSPLSSAGGSGSAGRPDPEGQEVTSSCLH